MDLTARLNAAIDRALTENRIVGAVTIVRRHGDLLCKSARGLADREADRPMTVNAIFRLSSLTKPIVATTILAMAATRACWALMTWRAITPRDGKYPLEIRDAIYAGL